MTTNHQNHNQITNPNPQPYHHSPPTTGKRKRKTTLQNHNQITNPQPHHHQQSEKEKEKQPPRESKSTSTRWPMPIRDPHDQLDDPRRSLSWWPTPISPQRRCPRRSETHEPRPTNLEPQNQITPLLSSSSISTATLRRQSGFRVQWRLGFEAWSMNLRRVELKPWNREKQKLREREKRKVRRKKRKSDRWE